ncbi:MAG: ATP-binding cassette domain-containing protein [Bdellovibrionota bacterium]
MKIESLKFDWACFGYEPGRPIFESMSLEIPVGKSYYVTGPPLLGKSTFMKMLSVLVQPEAGSFFINGQNTSNMSFEEFLPYRLNIGYAFDHGGLFANRFLIDNLTLGLMYHKFCSREEAEAKARAFAEDFGFTKLLGHRPASVPGGLRKLVTVLRAFMMEPEMLVLDDPFTGLDGDACAKLIKLIETRRESGEIKHLFLTARHPAIPAQLKCENLVIEHGTARFDGQAQWKAA